MLRVSFVRENSAAIIESLKKRNQDFSAIIHEIIALDDQRRQTQKESDDILASLNRSSKEIGDLFKAGKTQEANALKTEIPSLKDRSQALKDNLSQLEADIQEKLYVVPNVPNALVPAGKSDEDNEVVLEKGTFPQLAADAKPHWELADQYGLIDFDLGAKITGAGFPVYRKQGAKLQRALINFFLDEAEKAGFEEVIPPLLVNEASGIGTGQLPDKEGQMYHCGVDNLYLIPTAEVPVTNIYRDVILKQEDFPIKNCGYTPCFRREAGSYGKHVRGLNRLHQFDKVEIVQIVKPEESYRVLDEMVAHVSGLLDKLELPYRVLRLCGGDLGFTSALTYDLEVYSAAQERWLEVSSVSNFESFQANRLKCRFKDEDGNMQLAHTLNGSALALPRIVAALLENNQSAKGIRIPKALQTYTGFAFIA